MTFFDKHGRTYAVLYLTPWRENVKKVRKAAKRHADTVTTFAVLATRQRLHAAALFGSVDAQAVILDRDLGVSADVITTYTADDVAKALAPKPVYIATSVGQALAHLDEIARTEPISQITC